MFDSPIYLKKDETKEISVSTIVFTNQSMGNYTGNFTAIYKRDFRRQLFLKIRLNTNFRLKSKISSKPFTAGD